MEIGDLEIGDLTWPTQSPPFNLPNLHSPISNSRCPLVPDSWFLYSNTTHPLRPFGAVTYANSR